MFEIYNYKEQLKGLELGAKQSQQTRNRAFVTVMHFNFLNFYFVANVNNGKLPPFSVKM